MHLEELIGGLSDRKCIRFRKSQGICDRVGEI